MKKSLVLISLIFMTTFQVVGQTYAIPDMNFRNHLRYRFPSYFNFAGELIIDSAKNYTGYIDCSGQFINNLDGLQFFHNIRTFTCINNPLTHPFPSLDSLTKLEGLWLEYCFLHELPEISHLQSLGILSVKANFISDVSDVADLTALTYLDVSMNDIAQLPDLSALTMLRRLYAFKNELQEVPPLNALQDLLVLDVQENQLTRLPDLSSNTKLTRLAVNGNDLTELPDLSANTDLADLICFGNELTALPDLSNCLSLTKLLFHDNNIHSLPDLSGNVVLNFVRAEENALTFEDLIPLKAHPNFPMAFTISPQDTAGAYEYIKVTEGDSLELTCPVDEQVSGLTYYWSRDSVEAGQTNVNSIVISEPDSAIYTCKLASNDPEFAGFSLIVKIAKVASIPCISAASVNYTISRNECEGITIEINDDQISGLSPFTYRLFPEGGDDTLVFTSTTLTDLKPGVYGIEVSDSLDCSFTVNNYIFLPYPAGCGKSFTPNGDGNEDDFFVEKKGQARVYNKRGELIKEFETPSSWDGTDLSGRIVPMGYYIIMINEEEKIGVVVVQ